MRLVSRFGLASLAILANAGLASADFIIPAFRGGANTTHQQWESFNSPEGPNAPDVANANPNGTADLVELSGTSFIPSGGNIYSFAAVTEFEVTVPDYNLGAGHVTDVVVQIRTQGTRIDLSSVLWNGVAFDDSELLFEDSFTFTGFDAVLQDWKFTWNDLPGNLASNLLTFQSEESSLSLDRVAIDTQVTVVPEASTITLVGVGACGLVVAGLRRRVQR